MSRYILMLESADVELDDIHRNAGCVAGFVYLVDGPRGWPNAETADRWIDEEIARELEDDGALAEGKYRGDIAGERDDYVEGQ